MKFNDLTTGQHFDLGVDADGHEPVFYKINQTEAYQVAGRGAGLRKHFAPDDNVVAMNRVNDVHDAPTEVERVAVTLLSRTRSQHPGLQAWVKALIQNPDERRHVDDFVFQNDEIRELCLENGYACYREPWDHDHSAYAALIEERAYSGEDTAEWHRIKARDAATAKLAMAVRDYRMGGRPSGDQTHTIHGLDSPLLHVITSLAAAIVEYHHEIVEIWAADAMQKN